MNSITKNEAFSSDVHFQALTQTTNSCAYGERESILYSHRGILELKRKIR